MINESSSIQGMRIDLLPRVKKKERKCLLFALGKQFSSLSLPSLLPNQQSVDQILELLLIFSKSPQHQKSGCSYKIGAKT